MVRFPYSTVHQVWIDFYTQCMVLYGCCTIQCCSPSTRLQQKTQFIKNNTKMHHNGGFVVFVCFAVFSCSLLFLFSTMVSQSQMTLIVECFFYVLLLFLGYLHRFSVVVVFAAADFFCPLLLSQ